MTQLEKQGMAAKQASRVLAIAGSAKKDAALAAIAAALEARKDEILAANAVDMAAAKEAGMRPSLQDRLALDEGRIAGIVDGVRQVAALPDPIGAVTKMYNRPNGLTIGKRRVPLGVIGIIYEARPNVTVDAAALCLKAGNAVILRGGKEAFHSSQAMTAIMRDALEEAGLPADCIALVQDTTRQSATELMALTDYLDVLIPRGGAGLIRSVVENAKVPVIQTGTGVCHVYVDEKADLDMGANIIYNAKTSRPSVCNAAECLLVHAGVADAFLPKAKALLDQKQVELRGCPRAQAILGDCVVPAQEADWDTEYGDYILAVKVVDSAQEAIDFINDHGTGHSEAIVTQDYSAAQHFLDAVDAAAVYVNASTRFTDGGEFGLGAEIGISTQKMHARGPMGVEELTSSKYIIYGSGQIR
ncbi:glutamate-5-semialdehyde dehydrogenase [Pseudoflavonifractor phocaeensis]|uniref:glutamate-5-semialdehyde dehydrogenase n=1 Tax=Pseudoflavonifractor phocaeensis TaxID=1870988 RepID=UPI0019584FFF|nr:glutamate-5-semialdehyde dehydrogenase [Pseudoflavonifractor phocaeensis]MBM6869116.1 glutamate-5-semialdehyde dehydrogenase [Pseudoflavonifractor phocaeensis]MBM6939687.1 glutamate-5-semialdehyde dehydrogenase [Pseudoflavonifractor phocaeensis]